MRFWPAPILAFGIVGMLALVNADPSEETLHASPCERASELMTEFLSDADFVDTLRLCQVALHRGKIDPSRVTALARPDRRGVSRRRQPHES